MMEWLYMGGYWRYVWPCYLLTAVVVGLNIYIARRDFAAAVREARRRTATLRGES